METVSHRGRKTRFFRQLILIKNEHNSMIDLLSAATNSFLTTIAV